MSRLQKSVLNPKDAPFVKARQHVAALVASNQCILAASQSLDPLVQFSIKGCVPLPGTLRLLRLSACLLPVDCTRPLEDRNAADFVILCCCTIWRR